MMLTKLVNNDLKENCWDTCAWSYRHDAHLTMPYVQIYFDPHMYVLFVYVWASVTYHANEKQAWVITIYIINYTSHEPEHDDLSLETGMNSRNSTDVKHVSS
jgi:hypothetical protein